MLDKVALRRQAKVDSIVKAAWRLAREHGVSGLSLHGLAREVGMRQPSLYEYFDSKFALYDAMFADGNRELLARLGALRPSRNPRAAVKAWLATIAAFRSKTRLVTSCSSNATSRASHPRPGRTRWRKRSSPASSPCSTTRE